MHSYAKSITIHDYQELNTASDLPAAVHTFLSVPIGIRYIRALMAMHRTIFKN